MASKTVWLVERKNISINKTSPLRVCADRAGAERVIAEVGELDRKCGHDTSFSLTEIPFTRKRNR